MKYLIIILLLVGCTNQELSKRIAYVEEKVKQLEESQIILWTPPEYEDLQQYQYPEGVLLPYPMNERYWEWPKYEPPDADSVLADTSYYFLPDTVFIDTVFADTPSYSQPDMLIDSTGTIIVY